MITVSIASNFIFECLETRDLSKNSNDKVFVLILLQWHNRHRSIYS